MRCRAIQPRPQPLIARAINLAVVHSSTGTETCTLAIVGAAIPLATRAGVAAIVAQGTESRTG